MVAMGRLRAPCAPLSGKLPDMAMSCRMLHLQMSIVPVLLDMQGLVLVAVVLEALEHLMMMEQRNLTYDSWTQFHPSFLKVCRTVTGCDADPLCVQAILLFI